MSAGQVQPTPFAKDSPRGALLAVKLQPRASRTEILPPQAGELRVRVTSPPVDAAANEALVVLLAETLGLPRRAVELVRGHTSRHKTILLHGFSAIEAEARLLRAA